MGRFTRLRNSLTKTGRSINKAIRDISENQEVVQKYETTRKEIAHKMKILERDTVNLQSGNIALDVQVTVAAMRSKKISRKEIAKTLNSIVDKSIKSAREANKIMGEDVRTNIAVKELVELRMSEKYKAMANSAGKKGLVKSEADFWYRTVRLANKNLGIEPKKLMTKLNTELAKNDLEQLDKTNIAMLMSEEKNG